MGLDKRSKKESVGENSASSRKVEVIEDAVFQGACDNNLVKQELRYLPLVLSLLRSCLQYIVISRLIKA